MVEASVEILIAYGAILTLALIPIYIGSKKALHQKAPETMTAKDAWMFPLVGSTVLFGLYILFQTFSKEHLNLLLTAYFLIFGLGAIAATLAPWLEQLGSALLGRRKHKPYKFGFTPFWSKEKFSVDFTFFEALAFVLGALLTAWYAYEKHWIANNLLGLAFCIQAIAMLSLGSYKVGCILLGGLFIYDIFWVFGTDVMVTVAKSFDAPVKLLFPRNIWAEKHEFSMLGLGDIVIPGIFIALLLRFDAHRSSNKKNFSPLYFRISFFSYIVGLLTTIGVMHFFKAAQPALLYLVPACIGSSFLTAVVREELSILFAYSEEEDEKKSKSKKNKKKGGDNQQQQANGQLTEEETAVATSEPSSKKEKKKANKTTAQQSQQSQQPQKKQQPQQQQQPKAKASAKSATKKGKK